MITHPTVFALLASGAAMLLKVRMLLRRPLRRSQPDAAHILAVAAADAAGGASLSGAVILFLGRMPRRSRQEWTRIVHANEGRVARQLTRSVTHVVCGVKADQAAAFHDARDRGLPLLSEADLQRWIESGTLPLAGESTTLESSPTGYCFSFAGRLSAMPHAAWVKKLEENGFRVSKTLTSDVTHVVCAPAGVGTTRHKQALLKGIPVVPERALTHLLEHGSLPPAPVPTESDVTEHTEAQAQNHAPALLLAKSYTDQDVTGWWLSEKLDGLRAFWDGRRLISRNGNPYDAPDWFLAAIPDDLPLDGELWVGPNRFEDTSSICRTAESGDRWKQIKYVVFDAPEVPGGYEDRIEAIRKRLAASPGGPTPVVVLLPSRQCKDSADVLRELEEVVARGGEGLMLRQPGSPYERKRSSTLLKVKQFQDSEALVIGHKPGVGKHKGRLGSLLVQLASGVECYVGSGLSDEDRNNPPPIGCVITVRHFSSSKDGVPRFPTFWRIRPDFVWPPPQEP